MDRTKLLAVLGDMPDEAFTWFVAWAMGNDINRPGMFRFPDGLGGFKPESRAAIERLRAAATEYIDSAGG